VRILASGSRTWDDVDEIHDALDSMWLLWKEQGGDDPFVLVHGACRSGADRLADDWAAATSAVQVERHPAEWNKHGRKAGPIRNQHMVSLGADHVLVFIKGNSPGASHLMREARQAGLHVLEFREITEVAVTEETKTPTLVERLIEVKRDIGAVGKGDRNSQQGFNFRGIDSVLNAVSGPLIKHGVLVYPRLQSLDKGTVTTSGGKTMNTVVVTVEYMFTDGKDRISVVAPGEAFDSGDKCVAKAMSVAYRTALIQALSLPTDEPDPDHDIYDAQPKVSQLSDDDLLAAINAETDVDNLKAMWPAQGLAQRPAHLQAAMTKRAADLQAEPSA
jgi:hypothetical protein